MTREKRVTEPRSAVEIAENLKQLRQLIHVADLQIDRAKTDLGVARVGLAELEQELVTAGMRGKR